MENFAAPGYTAPAILPASFINAELSSRPLRVLGDQPVAAVILLEIDVQGLAA